MNDDFKRILVEMPKSILLYNEQENKVVLANDECCKIFSCPDNDGNEFINQKISEKIFSIYDDK